MSWWATGTAVGGAIHQNINEADASKRAQDAEREGEARAQARLDPYRQFGEQELTNMQNWLTSTGGQFQAPTAEDVTASPGYESRLGAVESSAAARGSLFSGNALRNVGEFGSDEYSREYNRKQTEYQNELSRRMGFVNLGYGAAGGSAGLAQNLGQRLAGYETGLGASQSRAIGESSSAIAGGIGQQQGQTNWNNFLTAYKDKNNNRIGSTDSWDDGNDYDDMGAW